MDAQSLKNIGSFIVWGGLFYVMMRYGCCAGHGRSHSRDKGETETGGKDPVCGMAVEPGKSGAVASHDGKTYYFCSTACRDKFEKAPDRYSGSAAKPSCHG